MPYKNRLVELPNYRAVCAKYPNHSLPRNHPENWPDGPWELVVPEPTPFTKEQLLSQLSWKRKQEEDTGIILNNIRYSGSSENRPTIDEALRAASEFSLTHFETWKDSDNIYHSNVPVADVRQALREIGLKRMSLIKKESEFSAEIEAGTLTDLENLQWY